MSGLDSVSESKNTVVMVTMAGATKLIGGCTLMPICCRGNRLQSRLGGCRVVRYAQHKGRAAQPTIR